MSLLDSLISKNNVEPSDEAKYLYYHNMAWPLERTDFGHVAVKSETPVEWVRKRENGSYHFKLEGDSVEYKTNYGWAFVLVTPENLAVFEELRIATAAAQEAERKRKSVYKRLKTLQEKPAMAKNGPSEKSVEDKPARIDAD